MDTVFVATPDIRPSTNGYALEAGPVRLILQQRSVALCSSEAIFTVMHLPNLQSKMEFSSDFKWARLKLLPY
ncbi:unnamed protein product [Leptidea sinapis]|uniref:Uncharacterized protein n=1 Tax=Leptidea sinapis TaxID=189913 RepID=A0A5E4PX85_9NEOP|nr:unnamed protein product [Leptidea sinapis]